MYIDSCIYMYESLSESKVRGENACLVGVSHEAQFHLDVEHHLPSQPIMESIATKCSLPIKLVINPLIITSENIVLSLKLNIVLLLLYYYFQTIPCIRLLGVYEYCSYIGIITCTCE